MSQSAKQKPTPITDPPDGDPAIEPVQIGITPIEHDGCREIRRPEPDDPKYNEVYQISSHNAFGRYDTEDEHEDHLKPGLLIQVKSHIFSLELDIHSKKENMPVVDKDWYVYHDEREKKSTCLKLSGCLSRLKSHHSSHPNHPVITIWIDLKLEEPPFSLRGHKAKNLDERLKSSLGRESIFSPGDYMQWSSVCRRRGTINTLRDAVKHCGWPTLGFLRGKFIIVLTGGGLNEYEQQTEGKGVAFVAPAYSSDDGEVPPHTAVYNVSVDSGSWRDLPSAQKFKGLVGRIYRIDDVGNWNKAIRARYNHLATDHVCEHATFKHGFYKLPRRVKVPRLFGASATKARDILTGLELVPVFGEPVLAEEPPFDQVVSTAPTEGVEVEIGTEVSVVVNTQGVRVLNVVGQEEDWAIQKLSGLKLNPNSIPNYVCDPPFNRVISTNPVADVVVKPRTSVDIIVSRELIVQVPDVKKQARDVAVANLQNARLRPTVIEEKSTDPRSWDLVFKTSPESGERVACNSSVTIFVRVPTPERADTR
jgi:beta-lactam-binding protein with PASTA domain